MKLQHQKYVRRNVNVLQMAAVALIYLYFYNFMLCFVPLLPGVNTTAVNKYIYLFIYNVPNFYIFHC
jgi:hypothetical protein